MGKIVVVDAVRSAVGRAKKGSLANRRPDELAGEVVRALMARNPEVVPPPIANLPGPMASISGPSAHECHSNTLRPFK